MIGSLSLGVGAAVGVVIASLVKRAARWFVRRTSTKRDDVALAAVEAFLRANPEVVAALADVVSMVALSQSESGDGDGER